MKIFASTNYTLARLPFGARLFYTLFLTTVLLGLVSCLGFILAKSGVTTAAVADYYRQEQWGLTGKSFLELLETAHFHLFSMPVLFLVLGHIFFLSEISENAKMFVILASFLSMVLQIALPFLIVYHSRQWAWAVHPVRVTLFATFLLFVAIPLKEMWWRGGPGLSLED